MHSSKCVRIHQTKLAHFQKFKNFKFDNNKIRTNEIRIRQELLVLASLVLGPTMLGCPRTATGMDGTLTLIFRKSETSRDIIKSF